jgi:sulfur-carrier protein
VSQPSRSGRHSTTWLRKVQYGPFVKVILYATLRAAVGSRIVELGPEIGPGSTVWDAVHALVARHPVLGSQLLDGDGQLWRHVHVMVNGRDAPYLQLGLDTPLSPDDTLDVFPPVGGG